MTQIGQMLIDEGMEKGMKKGIEKGIEKGMEKGIEKGMEMGMEKGIKKGIEKGAGALISACQEVGLTYDSTRKKLIEKLELDSSTASRYMEEFWSAFTKQ